ncbi:ATP-binding domain-containing protein [Limnobacter humi]|uniref:ATP-binding domain-containing protein n=1 Tax=Limnobacter humi TaxID=1778671 RepID=A0ABT1WI29_9BURK|nr:ATP-binding domain-containing protein [Limnobacter humi]MCQ8897181.1 ATP-binding domain-containing protein [Limnobacter humi]
MGAHVYPSLTPTALTAGWMAREQDLLMQLKARLPDGFVVYHGLHWTRMEHGMTVLGHIQFLVLCPSGLLIGLLMRTGLMTFQDGRLYKQHGNVQEDPVNALHRQMSQLQDKFLRAQPTKILKTDWVLYCPDFSVPNPQGLAVESSRVVDAAQKDTLATKLKLLNDAWANAGALLEPDHASSDQVHQFLCNALDLVPEVGALSEAADTVVTRLAQGLEQWVSRLDVEPFRLRVAGTAGCGKSLLALRELRQAAQAKSRALYVCYNRPLAAHVSGLVRQAEHMGVQVFNFHALCDRMLRDAGQEPDYSQQGAFARLPLAVLDLPVDLRWQFDTVVVDEGQDFDPAWLPVLLRLGHTRTRWLWLEDPEQNLYDQPAVPLPGWVKLTVPVNYRNPRRIVDALLTLQAKFQGMQGQPLEIESACPLDGLPLECLAYTTETELLAQTAKAVTRCLKQGFSRDRIVVLTMRGHEKSLVLKQQQLGPYSLRHFTGQYDEQGSQVFTQGGVLAESVYRFKGQSAQAVVITELALQEFSRQDFRKLFVAMTRATVSLSLVVEQGTLQSLGLRPGDWAA